MAAKNCSAYKVIGPEFSNEVCYTKLVYDFALDGGATTDTYRLAITGGKILVTKALVHVETACAGATATVEIGPTTADPDGFLDITSGAVANLTDDAVLSETTGQGLVVGDGDYITMLIKTAALTAGKINVILEWVKIA